MRLILKTIQIWKAKHCVKSVRIRSYSDPFSRIWSEYGHFLRSERRIFVFETMKPYNCT